MNIKENKSKSFGQIRPTQKLIDRPEIEKKKGKNEISSLVLNTQIVSDVKEGKVEKYN